MTALLNEIGLQKDYFSLNPQNTNQSAAVRLTTYDLRLPTINSIYFGGGTPSLLSEKEINSIFYQLSKYFQIQPGAENTLEANPDDLTKEYLKSLRKTPVNRLSIGIQSFSDPDLRFMNRAHDSEMALNSVQAANDAGFENLSIDLIYGTPGMNNETWINNLQTAFALNVNHLSCYSLTVEAKTALAKMIRQRKVAEVNDQKTADQFELLVKLSRENGFEHYEISNFCRNEKYAVHNSNYWKGEQYLGLGPSAHSYNGTSRQWNIANNSLYIKSLLNNKLNFEKEELTISQKYNEYVLTSLRTKWGTSLNQIINTFGVEFEKHFLKETKNFSKDGFLSEKENIFYLTDKGKLFADKIASGLFY